MYKKADTRSDMNGLTIFNYEGNEVRTVQRDGEPWWVLKDVCDILDLSNPTVVADRLDDDERVKVDPKQYLGSRSNEPITIISESGLYSAILLSRKPEAKKFKRWITHEILPSIRKHGLYATNALLDDSDLWIKALQELKAERARNAALTAESYEQKQRIEEYEPKAGYYDAVLGGSGTVAVSTIAKGYGKSGRWLNEYLHKLGVQYNQGGIWLLYQKYAEHDYTRTKTHVYTDEHGEFRSNLHTYWTQKGRVFIYNLLKENDILPLVERETVSK